MSNKYLLEIGTEELPYRFIPQAIEQLQTSFEKFLTTNQVKFEKIQVLATPRRLAVIIDGLDEQQPDEERIIKGPIKKVAYDESGNLTQAGKGFLHKNNVEEKDAYVENDYLHAKVFSKGILVSELLQENISKIILKLQGPYFMRWAGFDEKFSRPIRWIVSIFNDKELPVQIIDVKSSNITRGHRFSENLNVELKNADEYVEKLRAANVFVDQDERKALITKLTQEEAAKLGADAHYDEDLLEEVTYLCEYPVPVVCDFDAKYLNIPEKVTVTVMASHQRYFALYKDGKLLNKFITIANYLGDDFSNIKAGNERVIVARLDDAIFFFNEDTKKSLQEHVEALKGITFQKGLGSVYDKTQRIINLSKHIASTLSADSQTVERTALLCKADLTTSLVFEFTELQGFIGSDYARHSGEDEKVVQGIKEHYFPLNAESELADGSEGQIVGIADKLDTICAVFLGGKIPTGSSDPLGVRRAALGIIKTIMSKELKLDLNALIEKAFELLHNENTELKNEKIKQTKDFFVQRLTIFLAESYKKDVIEACVLNKNPLMNLCDFIDRVKLVSSMVERPEFAPIVESSNRISRILKEDVSISIEESLLHVDAEKELFKQIQENMNVDFTGYTNLLSALFNINPAIEKFFEDVLVMDKDEKIKQNRMAMLTILKKNYQLIADFSALQG